MSDRPPTPSADERAATIVGRLGTLIGMTLSVDGEGAGIALSKQEEMIADAIHDAEKAAAEQRDREWRDWLGAQGLSVGEGPDA